MTASNTTLRMVTGIRVFERDFHSDERGVVEVIDAIASTLEPNSAVDFLLHIAVECEARALRIDPHNRDTTH